MLWGREEQELEISMLHMVGEPLGAGILPTSLESLVEQSHRALLVGGLLLQSAGVITDA